ncbi:phage tail protein [Sphingosinicella sp. YJ22]|uniref:phage tail protein n=1 Tax=Sphingosinicella sp. YJ22 TaxID=1104780 RepID=UPI00140CB7DC|nr:phage tail protein [Sphingosinicella sp. YJ22]
MAVQRDKPYGEQNFLVDLGDGLTDEPDGAFSEVSGLDTWVDVTEYRSGAGRDSSPTKITGLARVADVTLKRGIIGTLRLYRWFNDVRNGDAGAIRTVTITLLAEDRTPVLVWKLIRARPVRYVAGSLNAEGTDVAMEELVLAYERLEME